MLVWKKISLFPCLLALIRVCSNSNFLPTSNPACLIELLVKGSFFLSAPKCKVFFSVLLDKINFSSLPSINDVLFFYTFQPLPSFLLKKILKIDHFLNFPTSSFFKFRCHLHMGTQRKTDLHNYFNPLLTKLQGCKGYQNLRNDPENLNFVVFSATTWVQRCQSQKHRQKS